MHFSKNFVGGAKLIFCQCLRLLNRVSFATSRGDTKKPVRTSRPDLWIICQSCSVLSHFCLISKVPILILFFVAAAAVGAVAAVVADGAAVVVLAVVGAADATKRCSHNRSLFQGHFFKAREPTYPRVRIKINKMIFSLFFCFTRVSSWRTFHRTGAGNLNWKNVFREADKAGPSWAWVEDRGRPWWPRQTPSWGPSASARSTPDTWQHRRLWPSTDPGKQIVKPMWARALRT